MYFGPWSASWHSRAQNEFWRENVCTIQFPAQIVCVNLIMAWKSSKWWIIHTSKTAMHLFFYQGRLKKKKITSNVEREFEMTTYPFETCNFINITHGYLFKKRYSCHVTTAGLRISRPIQMHSVRCIGNHPRYCIHKNK